MKKLDEKQIIQIFQKRLDIKPTVSDDVEFFNLGKSGFAVKTDTLVQSTDIPSKMKLEDAARKSIVACVSDFAAKGINPQYGIISVCIPRTISGSKIDDIAKGFRKASKEYNITILGGDTNEGKELVFTVCIFGKTTNKVRRIGAKKGDIIFVTGPFGYTSVGLDLMLQKKSFKKKTFLQKSINVFVNPKPKLKFGLQNKKYFSASMDSSDGLSTTLNELSNQSKRKFVVTKIPAKNDVKQYAISKKINLKNLVFHGGEEYEFVFTVPSKYKETIKKNAKLLKIPIMEIGHVTLGKGVFFYENDKFFPLEDHGWKHFR